jgi:Protein of unknown function (DUF998)
MSPNVVATVAALFALAAIFVAIALVVVLHYVEKEFDPSWRMLSEYSLGKRGILMRIAFVAGGTGVIAVGVALWGAAGPLSLGLPLVGLGPIGAAFVDTDPITTPRPEITRNGRVHSVFGSLYILGFPIAATVAGISAAASLAGGPLLAVAATVPWLGLVWFMAATVRSNSPDGVGSPAARIGWPNRFSMISYLAWVALACVLVLAS